MIVIIAPDGIQLHVPMEIVECFPGGPSLSEFIEGFGPMRVLYIPDSCDLFIRKGRKTWEPQEDIILEDGMKIIFKHSKKEMEPAGAWVRFYLGEKKRPGNRRCFANHYSEDENPIVKYIGDQENGGTSIEIVKEVEGEAQFFTVKYSVGDINRFLPEKHLKLWDAIRSIENNTRGKII